MKLPFILFAASSFIFINAYQFGFAEKLPDGPIYKWPGPPAIPADNPMTPEKIELGKKLFFDTRLSKASKISCNSCHNVLKAGDDGLPRSPGHEGKLGGRNSPTVFNAAYSSVQFWDGRAPTLEEQAKGPIINPVEMGMANHNAVVELIAKVPAYVQEFEKVFGKGPVTIDKMVKAIAAYERTLITPDSPYDRFVAGDKKAMSPAAQRGWRLVQSANCVMCHSGPMFNGAADKKVGEGFYMKFPLIPDAALETKYRFSEDLGRFNETHAEADKNMWRVPTWRNIALTAPYFHNGSVATLDEAVRVMAKTQLARELKPQEVGDIVEFLKALTGKAPKQTPPTLPESGPVAAK
jgi:cytochrome c peroxidase